MKVFAMIAVLSLHIGPAFAGPDASAQYLTNTPVTMMDLGILRLNLALRSQSGGFSSYDWDTNRIQIEAPFDIEYGSYLTIEQAEAACATWITKVRTQFGVDAEKGTPLLFEITFAAKLFEHEGYENANVPKTLYQDIDRMFVLQCAAGIPEKRLKVSSPLLGKGYSISKD